MDPEHEPSISLEIRSKKMLDDCLTTIPLKDKEIEIIDEFQNNEEKEEDTIYIPPFHIAKATICLLYTSPSPRDRTRSRMPSSA